MADDKQKTKKALLGELESIKSLLGDSSDIIDFSDKEDDENVDPPILTASIEDEQAELEIECDEIPILTEAFDNNVIAEVEETFAQTETTDAFEEPTLEQWLDDEDISNNESSENQDREGQPSTPSLFDPPLTQQNTTASTDSRSAPKEYGKIKQPPIKTDNPFLPKHIRDRLHTSRSLQDEIMNSPVFNTSAKNHNQKTDSPKTDNPMTNDNSTQLANENFSGSSPEQKLIEELVQSYLPKIEQELRHRLEKMLADELAVKHKNHDALHREDV